MFVWCHLRDLFVSWAKSYDWHISIITAMFVNTKYCNEPPHPTPPPWKQSPDASKFLGQRGSLLCWEFYSHYLESKANILREVGWTFTSFSAHQTYPGSSYKLHAPVSQDKTRLGFASSWDNVITDFTKSLNEPGANEIELESEIYLVVRCIKRGLSPVTFLLFCFCLILFKNLVSLALRACVAGHCPSFWQKPRVWTLHFGLCGPNYWSCWTSAAILASVVN